MLGPEPTATPEASGPVFTPALAYSALTPVYDLALEVVGLGRAFKAAIGGLAEVEPGEAVLDLGLGRGRCSKRSWPASPMARFTGIDPDPQVLAIARRRLQRIARPVKKVEGYVRNLRPGGQRTLIFHHLGTR